MSKAPAMPMYWDAYISDTTHLSTEEHGAYLLMLGAMWRRNGFIPDDDADNARITGLSKAKWRRFKCRVSGMIDIADGEISQQKLLKTWKITQEKIQKNRDNGAKGGRPKSIHNKDLEKANGYVPLNPNESIPEPEPYIKRTNVLSSADKANSQDDKRTRKKRTTSVPVDWVPDLQKAQILSEELNLTRDEMNYCYRQMKDHANAKDRKLVNWDAGFNSWVRKSVRDGEIGPGSRSRRNSSGVGKFEGV